LTTPIFKAIVCHMNDTDNNSSPTRVEIRESYIRPTAKFPQGSYLRTIDGEPDIATGFYEALYPGHPSLYWHGGAPFVVIDMDTYMDRMWTVVRETK
jgi:hypothetical protein